MTSRKYGAVRGRGAIFVSAVVVGHACFLATVRGADGTWTGATAVTDSTKTLWSTADNWAGSIVPGTTSGTNTDTAFFTVGSVANRGITIDAGRSIFKMVFNQDSNTTNSFTFGGSTVNSTPALTLLGGGTISVGYTGDLGSPPATTASPIFNSQVALAGPTYTFDNEASPNAVNNGIQFKGDVYPTGSSATTLTLTGVNVNVASNAGASIISGQIRDNGVTLGITKTGTGWWEFREAAAQSNTYSGPTLITAGVLRFNGAGALSPNTDITVMGSSAFRGSTTGAVAHSITLIGVNAQIKNSNDATTIGFTGGATQPAVTIDFSTESFSSSFTIIAGSTLLAGTIPDGGGFKYIAGPNAAQATWSKYLNVGTVERLLDVSHGGQNVGTNGAAGNVVDLSISGNLDGSGAVVKVGSGTVQFGSNGKTLTGQLEVREGGVRMSGFDTVFVNKPPLLVSGGTLDLTASTQQFASVTVTKGTIAGAFSSTSNTYGTLVAPSYLLAVNGSDAANITCQLTNVPGGTSNLVMSGSGTATVSGTIAYTGGTTVSGSGTLNIARLVTNASVGAVVVSGSGKVLFGPAASTSTYTVATIDPTVNVTGTGGYGIIQTDRSTFLPRVGILSSVSASSHFDVTNNDLVIHGVDLATVNAWVASHGLRSSVAGTGSGRDLLAGIGATVNSDGQGGSLFSTFDGQAVSSADVLVKYTYVGDTNLDGVVDASDLANLLAGEAGHLAGWINGDLNYDGQVNSVDYGLLMASLAGQGSSFGNPGAGETGAVPEPSMWAGIGVLAFAVGARRRR